MATQIQTFLIDAFTSQPFKGNPAGVCLLDSPLEPPLMQAIAAELNASETAFLVADASHSHTYSIRYFTPTVEIGFCGHATVAAAKLVLEKRKWPHVQFRTAQGLVLQAAPHESAVLLQFPLYLPKPYGPAPALWEALGLPAQPQVFLAEELHMLLLEVPSLEDLLLLRPDFTKLRQAVEGVKGLAVTTQTPDTPFDFQSRCFWPWVGIDEDPVTGSAHSALASYWSQRLQKKELKAYQCSRRGGSMELRITRDSTLEVKAFATIVLEGTLHLA
ncbi:PhzF family phenazine biosynthesis protein [Rufibacter quisquiliarum]|uniref:PhzF family phenazine biosynthesis protein n=1 Tax=Rufibacter quisquiliarum TaxID=1549639 RepID=A0A839GST0_9BACT|nr:PhzF family phenazine biosynthesis protein [Rufibacter quisquiliarum]MBA9077927.1 PhzF family phenazine biosynthesis protein [Rufibacter quisquiliarum]